MEQNHPSVEAVPASASLGVPQNSFRTPAPPPPLTAKREDGLLALLALPCGYLYVRFALSFIGGVGITLFTLVYCGVVLAWFRAGGHPIPKKSWLWLGLTLLSALHFSLFSAGFITFLTFLFLTGCAVWWVAVLGGSSPAEGITLGAFGERLFLLPMRNFGCQWQVLRQRSRKSDQSRSLFLALITALLMVPLLLYVAGQLAEADDTFRLLVENLSPQNASWALWLLVRLLLTLPVSAYLFGLWYGSFHHRGVKCLTPEEQALREARRRIIPTAVAVTSLGMLTALYLVFFAAQTAGLVYAIVQGQPQAGSWSAYARQGFFELCQVSMLNLAVLLAARQLTRHKENAITLFLCRVLPVQTLLLIATALCKMGLYIRAYGLTQLRVYTSWFMALLAAVFLLQLLSLWKPFPWQRWLAAVFCGWFLVLSFSNVDGIIARHNLDRYLSGDGDSLTLAPLYTPAAAAPLLDARDRLPPDDPRREVIEDALLSLRYRLEVGVGPSSTPWYGKNLQELLAVHLLERQGPPLS